MGEIIPFPVWIIPFPVLKINFETLGTNEKKRDLRVSFPPFSWGKVWPLIGQAAHGRLAGIN